jgi:hypothetical protein
MGSLFAGILAFLAQSISNKDQREIVIHGSVIFLYLGLLFKNDKMGLAYSDSLSLWALISLESGTAPNVCFSTFGFEKEGSTIGLWELVKKEEVVVVDDVVEIDG